MVSTWSYDGKGFQDNAAVREARQARQQQKDKVMREPTDDEIERACAAGNYGTGRDVMRTMLRAALNPPTAPEIKVTQEMAAAGLAAYFDMRHANGPESITAAFRAMRKVEIAMMPFKVNFRFDEGFMHRRSTDPAPALYFGRPLARYHHRKDDTLGPHQIRMRRYSDRECMVKFI